MGRQITTSFLLLTQRRQAASIINRRLWGFDVSHVTKHFAHYSFKGQQDRPGTAGGGGMKYIYRG
jgi:hypothetical protein